MSCAMLPRIRWAIRESRSRQRRVRRAWQRWQRDLANAALREGWIRFADELSAVYLLTPRGRRRLHRHTKAVA